MMNKKDLESSVFQLCDHSSALVDIMFIRYSFLQIYTFQKTSRTIKMSKYLCSFFCKANIFARKMEICGGNYSFATFGQQNGQGQVRNKLNLSKK